jgi:hypothetical protein
MYARGTSVVVLKSHRPFLRVLETLDRDLLVCGKFLGILFLTAHQTGLRRLARVSVLARTVRQPMATTKQTRRVKPEERELARKRGEQERLEAELAECELRLASIRGELGALERRYLKLVGLPYAELDELRAQVAERRAAEDPENERLQRAALEGRLRADESRSAASVKESEEIKHFSPTPELKHAYRELAKRIHPDLTANDADRARRQELMAEANEAYQRGDEERLAKILDTYESSPETVEGEGPGAELIRVIRKLSLMKNRLGEIETETQKFFNSDLYLLKVQMEEAHEQGRDLLAEMADKVRKRIADCKERLEVFASGRVH